MDTSSLKQAVTAPVTKSRLPAGSTLEIAPGVHVPHPEAEVNLPGAGDPRIGETSAVTEKSVIVDGVLTLDQRPLADEVRVSFPSVGAPVVVTVTPSSPVVPVDPEVSKA